MHVLSGTLIIRRTSVYCRKSARFVANSYNMTSVIERLSKMRKLAPTKDPNRSHHNVPDSLQFRQSGAVKLIRITGQVDLHACYDIDTKSVKT